MELKDKNILITGSTGLLGRALTHTFSEQGANLYLLASSWDDEKKDWAMSLPKEPKLLLTAELADPRSIQQIFRALPIIDILINNAGVQELSTIEEITPKDMDHFSSINLHAPILLTSLMAKQPTDRTDRAIVNILSIEAENPAVMHTLYGASKGGLLQFSRGAALELGPKGIRVNSVSPGVIYREGIEKAWPDGVSRFISSSPLGRLVSPNEVAEAVLFLSSPRASSITGINMRVDAGIGVTTGY